MISYAVWLYFRFPLSLRMVEEMLAARGICVTIILEFQGIIRRKALADLDAWLPKARASLVAAFANGVSKDRAAIEAAITLPWSNGQTEGQICKLKLVKRQMYGRGNLDLLQARVMGLG